LYFGTSVCEGCHSAPPKEWKKALACRCDELTRWKDRYKHPETYNVLPDGRGKQITNTLGWKVADQRCVSCHGIVVGEGAPRRGQSFREEDGVSCVVCHGAYKEWRFEHADPDSMWRQLTGAQEEEWYGMANLRDAATRAEKCASCHVGDAGGARW
jgi:hypothetical protein